MFLLLKERQSRKSGDARPGASCLSILAIALLFTFASSVQATPIPITDLISNNLSITEGDKLFSDFNVVFTPSGVPTAPPDASGILVEGVTLGGNHGLSFTGGMFAGAGASLDILITYMATALSETEMISDINLIFNGAVTGDGFTNVVETVLDGVDVIGQAVVTNPPQVLSQTIVLDRFVKTALINKDIFLTGNTNGTATISFIDQALSQAVPPQIVPEPATLLLLGAGLMSLVHFGRGRQRFRR